MGMDTRWIQCQGMRCRKQKYVQILDGLNVPVSLGWFILLLLSICTYEISPGRGSMCASSTSEAVVWDFSGQSLVLQLFKPVSSVSNTELPATFDFYLSSFFTWFQAPRGNESEV